MRFLSLPVQDKDHQLVLNTGASHVEIRVVKPKKNVGYLLRTQRQLNASMSVSSSSLKRFFVAGDTIYAEEIPNIHQWHTLSPDCLSMTVSDSPRAGLPPAHASLHTPLAFLICARVLNTGFSVYLEHFFLLCVAGLE